MSDTPAPATTAAPAQPPSAAPAPVPSAPDILTQGTGQPAASWMDTLPQELKSDPTLGKFKDVNGLAKSYVEAQKLIGKAKIEAPNENWKDEQWGDLYDKLGRPKTPDDYKFDRSVIPQGQAPDEVMEKYFAGEMHKAGLSQKQADALYKQFVAYQTQGMTAEQTRAAQQAEQGVAQLKQEWGDKFNAKADTAFRAAREFGGQDLTQLLEETGLGNHPALIKMFVKIGESMSEDGIRGGNSGGTFTQSPAQALSEIGQLKIDKDFMAAFNNRSNPGHKEAVKRWNDLHQKAYNVKAQL